MRQKLLLIILPLLLSSLVMAQGYLPQSISELNNSGGIDTSILVLFAATISAFFLILLLKPISQLIVKIVGLI